MADINGLKEKVAKAAEKVEKCKKTIERHETQLAKKLSKVSGYGVTLENLAEMREKYRGSDTSWELYEVESKVSDIKGATKKLRDAETVLENWKTKLNVALEKERFIEGNAPQVIKDFLEEWKQLAFDWHVKRVDHYKKRCIEIDTEVKEAMIEAVKTIPEYSRYLEESGEVKEYYTSEFSLINIWPRKPMEDYLKEQGLDRKSVNEMKMMAAGSAFVIELARIRDKEARLDKLEKELERDKQYKMLDLINRINDRVGKIEDATNLKLRAGNLNGYIIGENGTAKVETIGAGGYNIQCFHYRTLIHKIK